MQTSIDMENIELAGNTKNEVDPNVKNKSPHFLLVQQYENLSKQQTRTPTHHYIQSCKLQQCTVA